MISLNLMWLCVAVSLLTGVTSNTSAVPVENRGYILIGDSRTVGMDSACDVRVHANVFVVAEVGQGLDWYERKGAFEVERIKREHDEYDVWTLVSNLGANDLSNYQAYIDYFSAIEDDFVFVSVNPVKKHTSITNESIDKFNSEMRSSGFEYIDTNLLLRLEGFRAPDGLHYTPETYQTIWGYLERELCLV